MKPVLLLMGLLPAASLAGVIEVSLKLPLKPRLPLTGDERLAIAPFVIMTTDQEARTDRAAKVDIQSEFARYLRKQVAKATKLQVLEVGSTRLPGNTIKDLAANRDYWKELAARTGADFVLSGVIDFDVEDKSGYRTEEFVSPVDGRTYYRQVLVETTGFVFDIVIAVFDGDSGEKLIEENSRFSPPCVV